MNEPAGKEQRWIVSIHDKKPNRVLAFDLKDVLEALGPRVQAFQWRITELDCSGSPLGWKWSQEIAANRPEGIPVTYPELSAYAHAVAQTIWGFFRAEAPDQGRNEVPPLVIQAFDSSFFVVATTHRDDIAALRSRFRDVRDEPEWDFDLY